MTRDVISANEIANRVNWRRGPRRHAAATGISIAEKNFSLAFLAVLFSPE